VKVREPHGVARIEALSLLGRHCMWRDNSVMCGG
jgi:hypothetical protein